MSKLVTTVTVPLTSCDPNPFISNFQVAKTKVPQFSQFLHHFTGGKLKDGPFIRKNSINLASVK
jgi:hypothetical protein